MRPNESFRPAPSLVEGGLLPEQSRRRPWQGLAVSLLLHGALVLLIVLMRRPPEPPKETPAAPDTHPRVEMVYVTPPAARPRPQPVRPSEPRPVPPPEVHPAPKTPPHDEAEGAPEPARTPPPVPSASPSRDPAPSPPAPAASDAPGPQVATAPTMESEARRLFGRHQVNRGDAGPLATPGLPVYIAPNPDACVPKPRPEGAPIELASISGQVKSNKGFPLPGAHLQIIGTGYNTFADAAGNYTLTFDKSLVDDCHSQLVRISAPGYSARNVVLSMGVGTNDVALNRR